MKHIFWVSSITWEFHDFVYIAEKYSNDKKNGLGLLSLLIWQVTGDQAADRANIYFSRFCGKNPHTRMSAVVLVGVLSRIFPW